MPNLASLSLSLSLSHVSVHPVHTLACDLQKKAFVATDPRPLRPPLPPCLPRSLPAPYNEAGITLVGEMCTATGRSKEFVTTIPEREREIERERERETFHLVASDYIMCIVKARTQTASQLVHGTKSSNY